MKRALIALAAAALTVLALAGPASAAPGQVTHFRFHGTFAAAEWFASSDSSITDTYIDVSQSKQGPELFVDQLAGTVDANGNFAGGTETTADVTSGFSFAIDQVKLASASTSASAVPATACILDADFNRISCSPTTIDVNASWTGEGPITRGVSNDHFKADGMSVNDHFTGTRRSATATGSIGGVTLNAANLVGAVLGTTKSGTGTVCIGNNC